MKKTGRFLLACGILILAVPALYAQNDSQTSSLKGMTLNGATGLYTVPSGRIGWERSADVGLDLGGSFNFIEHNGVVKAGLSLFKWVELTGAVDFQPMDEEYLTIPRAGLRYSYKDGDFDNDIIFGAKVQFPTGKTAVALGGNLQVLSRDEHWRSAGQIYAAATYGGSFFDWPAEVSLALGYTFTKEGHKDIDFGMGFDMVLMPNVLKNFVHWIVDFSNFSYSVDSMGIDPWYRGDLNTGIRVDLAAIPALKKFKFNVDLMLLDILDDDDAQTGGRTVAVNLVFGVPLKQAR
ncbi:MAG: hypothetical protein LBQ55_10575 [Treponema sp.]|jgi:hypothetical protein|nr:hypothetical protein [Treponema sp.]